MALVASLSGAARNDGSQKSHFIRKRVQFSDGAFGANAGARVGRIPARTFIQQISIHKIAAFNSGTSDNVTIGTTSTGTDILASTVLTGTGFVNLSTAAGLGMAVTSETDVFVRWVASGAAATAGDVTVVMVFVPDNDN